MKIYNTLTKKVDEFISHNNEEVKLYTCGPTVYNYAHIGNLRTYIFEDILEKALIFLGYKVKRVMNITDVGHLTSDADTGEDKMILGSIRENKSVLELSEFYTNAFFKDFEKLNIKKPSIIEKATDNIDQYIKIIKDLISKDYAYVAKNGNVYFDISKAKDYYKLSGKNEKDLIIAARDNVENDTYKHNPFDFALWFVSSKYENHALRWDSPWGEGYPGWHIECSGICIKNFGDNVDIHTGAVDNIFPHHTNEIAQSEAYIGDKWCNYWMHAEHLNDLSGKMSKSKGEFLILSVLESKGYKPLEYRYFCLLSHYRNQLVFSYEALDNAKTAYNKLVDRIRIVLENNNDIVDNNIVNIYKNKISDSIGNDLNTANVITTLYDVLKDNISNSSKIEIIKLVDSILSLDLLKKEDTSDVDVKYIEEMIEKRKQAKEEKNYQLADSIREELKNNNIEIIDTKEKTTWKKIV